MPLTGMGKPVRDTRGAGLGFWGIGIGIESSDLALVPCSPTRHSLGSVEDAVAGLRDEFRGKLGLAVSLEV